MILKKGINRLPRSNFFSPSTAVRRPQKFCRTSSEKSDNRRRCRVSNERVLQPSNMEYLLVFQLVRTNKKGRKTLKKDVKTRAHPEYCVVIPRAHIRTVYFPFLFSLIKKGPEKNNFYQFFFRRGFAAARLSGRARQPVAIHQVGTPSPMWRGRRRCWRACHDRPFSVQTWTGGRRGKK